MWAVEGGMMAYWRSSAAQGAMAIDLGEACLTALVMMPGASGPAVCWWYQHLLPAGLMDRHRIMDPARLGSFLGALRAQIAHADMPTLMALPDGLVISRESQLPSGMDAKALAQHFSMLLEELMPGDASHLCMDYARQGALPRGLESWEMVACRRECVRERTDLLQRSGFRIDIVETESHAMQRCVGWLAGLAAHDPCLAVLLERETSLSLTLWQNGMPVEKHTLPREVLNMEQSGKMVSPFRRYLVSHEMEGEDARALCVWYAGRLLESADGWLAHIAPVPAKPIQKLILGRLPDLAACHEDAPVDGVTLMRLIGLALRGCGIVRD